MHTIYLSLLGGLSSAVMGKKSSCLSIRTQTKSVQTLLHSISVCGSFVCQCVCVCVWVCVCVGGGGGGGGPLHNLAEHGSPSPL